MAAAGLGTERLLSTRRSGLCRSASWYQAQVALVYAAGQGKDFDPACPAKRCRLLFTK